MNYEIDGETIPAEETWDVEFLEDEVEHVPALKRLEIDVGLCQVVTIAKTSQGKYFAFWEERHPELGIYDEYFPPAASDDPLERVGFAKRTRARLEKWHELERRMPSKYFAEEISREDAYCLIAWFWLPKEFHAEAGV